MKRLLFLFSVLMTVAQAKTLVVNATGADGEPAFQTVLAVPVDGRVATLEQGDKVTHQALRTTTKTADGRVTTKEYVMEQTWLGVSLKAHEAKDGVVVVSLVRTSLARVEKSPDGESEHPVVKVDHVDRTITGKALVVENCGKLGTVRFTVLE